MLPTDSEFILILLNTRIAAIEKFITEGGIGYQPCLDEYIAIRTCIQNLRDKP